jgi:hypothetical protein
VNRIHSLFLALTTNLYECAFCGRRHPRRFYTARMVFSICDDCVRGLAKDLAMNQQMPGNPKANNGGGRDEIHTPSA